MEPAIPGLVGLHASYISAQLGAFRYGTRTAAEPDCMQIVAASLTESDVTAVAAWLASLPIPADPSPVPHGTLADAARLRQRTELSGEAPCAIRRTLLPLAVLLARPAVLGGVSHRRQRVPMTRP